MEYWIWLTQIPYIGPVGQKNLLNHFTSPQEIYFAKEDQLKKLPFLNKGQLNSILACRSLEKAKRIQNQCQKSKVQLLTFESSLYPKSLKEIHDPPSVLYYRGQIKETEKLAGIVGARRCTQEDKARVIELTDKYTSLGYGIVSGMAKGVDAYAHTQCLKQGGYTIAIFGNGPDICYPKEHQGLMEAICEKGLILSEYPPQTMPREYNFPRRNRIISALSSELVVVAAKKGSGTESTRRFALEYGRQVIDIETIGL